LLHWLQVCERLLGEARLLAKSLTADVERLTREKKDQADRTEAKQVGMTCAPKQHDVNGLFWGWHHTCVATVAAMLQASRAAHRTDAVQLPRHIHCIIWQRQLASWTCADALLRYCRLLQARLELEQQRLTGELTASERKLELTSADLAAERDRVAGMAAVMERKVSRVQGFCTPALCSCGDLFAACKQHRTP
jgi:hypothetical protein